MPATFALFVCLIFIAWLFYTDCRRRENISFALWIPITWVCIIGSRPVSFWMGSDAGFTDASGYVEGTLLDKGVYLFLIVAGLLVLSRRGVTWRSVFARNKWVCLYFLYLGISVLWSGDPFVSCKRWIKDVGHVVMVLVVLSEEEPVEAVRVILARCAYLLIPLSVLVIRYYPWISRNYNMWTNEPVIMGLSTDKNSLGMTSFVCGLPLVWMLLELRDEPERGEDKSAWFRYLALIAMTAWLLLKSHSATALGCTVLGGCTLLGMKLTAIRSKVMRLGVYSGGILLLVGSLVVSLDLGSAVVKFLGRDMTFTGRTAIWKAVLNEDVNPLIGDGYYSFWSADRVKKLSESYFYELNEAHNGYIETYLNSGLIGVLLLIVMIASATKRIKQDAHDGHGFGPLRLAFLITILIYNITESTFDRLTPVWFTLLLVMVEWSGPRDERAEIDELATAEMREAVTDGQERFRLANCPVLGENHWQQTGFVAR